MEWAKIPTDILLSRIPDKEIIAIVKYQLIWASLEREPTKEICLRYMTSKQLQQALNYRSAIERRMNADIKTVESNRNRQKIFYQKNQTLDKKPNGQTNCQTNCQADSQTNDTDKIRLDKIKEKEKEKEKFDEFWEEYKPVSGRDGTCVAKGSKSRCLEKYIRIVKKDDPQKIITGLKNYLGYCKENRICSCGAEVFLNQRRWENEYKIGGQENGYNPRL